MVGGVQQKGAANDEAVDRSQADEDPRGARVRRCAAEEAAGRGGHNGVHEEETGEEHCHSSDSFGDSAEVRGKEEECELTWSFGAQSVDDANAERDWSCVAEALLLI